MDLRGANVIKSLLGMKRFHHYGLLIDCRNLTILYPKSDIRFNFIFCEAHTLVLCHNSVSSSVEDHILNEFPNLISPLNPLKNSNSSSRVSYRLEIRDGAPFFFKE